MPSDSLDPRKITPCIPGPTDLGRPGISEVEQARRNQAAVAAYASKSQSGRLGFTAEGLQQPPMYPSDIETAEKPQKVLDRVLGILIDNQDIADAIHKGLSEILDRLDGGAPQASKGENAPRQVKEGGVLGTLEGYAEIQRNKLHGIQYLLERLSRL